MRLERTQRARWLPWLVVATLACNLLTPATLAAPTATAAPAIPTELGQAVTAAPTRTAPPATVITAPTLTALPPTPTELGQAAQAATMLLSLS